MGTKESDGLESASQQREGVARFFSSVMIPISRITMRFGFSAREADRIMRWSFVRSFFDAPSF